MTTLATPLTLAGHPAPAERPWQTLYDLVYAVETAKAYGDSNTVAARDARDNAAEVWAEALVTLEQRFGDRLCCLAARDVLGYRACPGCEDGL